MSRRSWPGRQREEYEQICAEAWASATSTAGRTEAFLTRIRDAEQAHRLFARDTLRRIEEIGAASLLKSWKKQQRKVAVAYDGRLISKPRVIGARRADPDGVEYAEQTLFDLMTFDELRVKLKEYRQQVGAYTENAYLVDKLLDLERQAPGTATPQGACERLGTTVEAYLAIDAA